MKKSSIIRTFITYILLLAIAVYAISMMNSEVAKNMSYTEFLQKIEEKSVEKIVIDSSKQMADVKIKNEEKQQYEVNIPDITTFMEFAQPKAKDGEFELERASESTFEILAPYIPNIILLVGTLFLFFVLSELIPLIMLHYTMVLL